MSGGNPYIRELQERSRKNKEKNEKELLERYWTESYGSYFSFGYNKELKKDPETGEWALVTPDDFITKAIRKAGLLPDMD